MSQPKLTLRPPPNVDFVQGYPGIPPGPDRLQAAVKGAIEVRVGQQGVKAKWVRIELRKVETLPGGGVANTFYDFVGQSPINLWHSQGDEYSLLHTNDFPFFIRIPESIPPTLALEKGAGIKYELIASVCVQGKKGFLRRDKPTITATASPIVVDKHELHSTWPIYSQPETRTHSLDGVTLLVERSHTCYGPGDRIVVMATVKSDTLHTISLRGFEFMLRETTVLRASPHTQGKKGSPQVKVSSIGEQTVAVNATLYGGTQHREELSVIVPKHHTSATINAARHIDINYVLTVKALVGTGQPIILDLPIMISNWPRAVSTEAMRRIGHAFNVSLPGQAVDPQAPQVQSPLVQSSLAQQTPSLLDSLSFQSSNGYLNSFDLKAPARDIRSANNSNRGALGQFSTVPANSDRLTSAAGELGGASYTAQTIGATNVGGTRPRASSAASNEDRHMSASGRPRSSNGRSNTAQRLTIVNITEKEMNEHMEAEAQLARRLPPVILESPVTLSPSEQPGTGDQSLASAFVPPPPKTSSKKWGNQDWITAEKEKELLYQRAVADVERTQGLGPPSVDRMTQNDASGSSQSPVPTSSKPSARWPSAEDEKARLFNQAQAAVARARGGEVPGSSSSHNMGASSSSSGGERVSSMSAGAALYSEAMSAINKPAEDEKAILQRYLDAKNAVYQTQSAYHGRVPGNAGPVPYDALFPNQPVSPAASGAHIQPLASLSPAPSDPPPSFATVSGPSLQHPILSEKERMRRHYQAQDAAAAQPQQLQSWWPAPPPDPHTPPPPDPYAALPLAADPRFSSQAPAGSPPPFSQPTSPMSAYAEKEMLRRRYEQQDVGTLTSSGYTPTPPPRASYNGVGGRGRPPPTPPISPGTPGTPMSGRPLTAAEEKARLKAMFDAEDRGAARQSGPPPSIHSPYPSPPPSNGYHSEHEPAASSPISVPPPPPLAPKPPREYIEETRAEDLRTAAKLQAIDAANPASGLRSLKQADPDLASITTTDLDDDDDENEHGNGNENEDGEGEGDADVDPSETNGGDNTFGPGTLSALSFGSGSGGSGSGSSPISRSASAGPSGATCIAPPIVSPPPPLPPKVLIE